MVRDRIHQPSHYKNGGRDPQDEHARGLAEAVSDRFKDATEGMQERVGQVARRSNMRKWLETPSNNSSRLCRNHSGSIQ